MISQAPNATTSAGFSVRAGTFPPLTSQAATTPINAAMPPTIAARVEGVVVVVVLSATRTPSRVGLARGSPNDTTSVFVPRLAR